MDSLASNPAGSSAGIYGAVNPNQQMDDYATHALSFVNRMKDREMQDFKDKAMFMADLSLKQDRLRKLYDPNVQDTNQDPSNTKGMNTVMARDPNEMTGYEKGELGIRQQQLGQESQRIAQQGKLGQEALDVRNAQEKLNEQKNQQIFETKMKDMERKTQEAEQKAELARQRLEQQGQTIENLKAYHDAQMAANQAKFDAQTALQQGRFEELQRSHKALEVDRARRTDQAGRTSVDVKVNPEGTERTTTTTRGSQSFPTRNSDGTYHVIGPNGQEGDIPGDKLDDWLSNHQPGSQQQEE